MGKCEELTVNRLEYRARNIRRIQSIMNTILANACYSDKSMSEQIKKGEMQGDLNTQEHRILTEAWTVRKLLAQNLLTDLEIWLKRQKEELEN